MLAYDLELDEVDFSSSSHLSNRDLAAAIKAAEDAYASAGGWCRRGEPLEGLSRGHALLRLERLIRWYRPQPSLGKIEELGTTAEDVNADVRAANPEVLEAVMAEADRRLWAHWAQDVRV